MSGKPSSARMIERAVFRSPEARRLRADIVKAVDSYSEFLVDKGLVFGNLSKDAQGHTQGDPTHQGPTALVVRLCYLTGDLSVCFEESIDLPPDDTDGGPTFICRYGADMNGPEE